MLIFSKKGHSIDNKSFFESFYFVRHFFLSESGEEWASNLDLLHTPIPPFQKEIAVTMPRYPLRILVFTLACLGGTQGCVSRPESPPTSPAAAGTTINAPTVVNSPSGSQLGLQVTRNPNDPNRGWVMLGNQPIPVRMEAGAWIFDANPTPSPQPQPAPTPQSKPTPAPSPRGGAGTPDTSPPAIPPGFMSPTVAQELLLIDKIELYRTMLARMKTLAASAQLSSVDELTAVINRLETLLKEMERLQNSLEQPPQTRP